jgi:rsbT antagonist protein RsbS
MTVTTIPILRIGKVLIASIQCELSDSSVDRFRGEVLRRIQAERSKGLIIDISTVEMIDTYTARVLYKLSQMTKVMGAETVIVGMSAEVAATLVRMGLLLPEVRTALDLEEGLQLLGVLPKAA